MSLISTDSTLSEQGARFSLTGTVSKAQPSESNERLFTESSNGRQLLTETDTSHAQSTTQKIAKIFQKIHFERWKKNAIHRISWKRITTSYNMTKIMTQRKTYVPISTNFRRIGGGGEGREGRQRKTNRLHHLLNLVIFGHFMCHRIIVPASSYKYTRPATHPNKSLNMLSAGPSLKDRSDSHFVCCGASCLMNGFQCSFLTLNYNRIP